MTTGFLAGWLTPFAWTCGFFALALFAFLAATYLTVATLPQSDLQNDFRLRALWAEAALIPLAIIVFMTSKGGAPGIYHEVSFILVGWGLAQFPHLITPNVTVQNAAAPESTLKLLLLALGAGAVVLLPSLLYLFQIFKRQAER